MKITTTAGVFTELMGRVARAVSARSTTPVLSGVLFRAQKGEGTSPGP
jgi:DNA polymerase III sliding clamp (beta) subunit (PCNA family)